MALDITDVYATFFKASSTFGVIPYSIDIKNLKIKRIMGGFPFYFFVFNICFALFSLFKHATIIFTILMNPDFALVELILQVLYLDGCIMVSLILINQHIYSKDIANLITMLLRLDKEIFDLSGTTFESRQKYLKIRMIWARLLRLGWIGGLSAATVMYFAFPRLPIFINLIVPREYEIDGEWWNSLIVRAIIGLPDMYMFPIGWSILLSFDILMGTIASQMEYYLRVLYRSHLPSPHEVKIFKSLQLLMLTMNGAFANGMVAHMIFITVLTLCFIFGAIRNGGNLVIFVFFFMNAFLLTVRLIFLLMPLANLEAVSVKVIHNFRVYPTEVNVPASRREIMSVRKMKVSSGGFYKIDYDCIFHYTNFLVSYIIVIIST